MHNNWAFMIWIALTGFVGLFLNTQKTEYVLGKREIRTRWPWAIIMFAPVAWGAAVRGLHEGDTGTYKRMFDKIPSELSQWQTIFEMEERDGGYTVLEFLFKTFIGDNFQLFIGIIAVLSALAVVFLYRKYSCSYLLSIFLFVIGFDYYQWLFNGMRQFMAVAIIILFTEDMLKGNYRRLIFPFAIAAFFHMSVLLLVPCLFFVKGKALNKKMVIFVMGGIVVGAFLGVTGQLNDIIANLMVETQYDSVLDEFLMTMDYGTNVLRVAVYSMPTVIAIVGLKYIWRADDPIINFATNMSLISTGIYIISMFTSAIMIGRLPIYFSIYNHILMPWLLKHMFTEKSEKLVIMAMAFFYLIYNYYQVTAVYGLSFSLGFLGNIL